MRSGRVSHPFHASVAIGLIAAASTVTGSCARLKPDHPAADRQLPAFAVTATGLSSAESAALQRGFRLDRIARDEAGVVRFLDERSFLAVPTTALRPVRTLREGGETGKITFERIDFVGLERLTVPDSERAVAEVQKILAETRTVPAEARPSVSHTRFEAVDAKGEMLADRPIDTTVSYRFTLAGLPLEGPGAKVRVAFGPDGRVTQLIHATRRLEPAGKVPVVDAAEGRKRCATWAARDDARAMKDVVAELAYYAPPLSERIDRLEPSYRCRLIDATGASSQVFFVPATVAARRPALPAPQPPRREAAVAAGAAARSIERIDVGSEGTGPCSGLPWTGINVGTFNDRMSLGGIPVQFSWLDANAWEDDWKDGTLGGHDQDWVDDVDMAYWQGHGWPGGFSFAGCSSIDDAGLVMGDARWGNRDAEWMSLFTCLVLAEEDGGQRWWQRWGRAFQGLHQINSFDTVSWHSAQHGGIYANYLLGFPFFGTTILNLKVVSAWAQASIDDQPDAAVWASMGVLGHGGVTNYNDYFWGRGPVGPDIPAAQITGYWRVSGSS